MVKDETILRFSMDAVMKYHLQNIFLLHRENNDELQEEIFNSNINAGILGKIGDLDKQFHTERTGIIVTENILSGEYLLIKKIVTNILIYLSLSLRGPNKDSRTGGICFHFL